MNKKKIAWISCSLFAATLAGCAAVKSVGDSMGGKYGGLISASATAGQALTMNEKDEAVIGRSLAISITNQYPVASNQQLLTYVNYVGQTLVSVSSKPDRHYIFGVLDSDKIGAFSAPDGYIFVMRKAITFAQDEAELAGVLGHELTHVINQHGLKAVKTAMLQSAAIHGAASAAKIQDALPALDAAGDMITKNGYDKPQEFEADAGSVHLLVAAGYNPQSFLNYLKRLDAQQSSANGGGVMSTHPGTHERVGKVAQQIASSGAQGGVTLKDRFHSTVFPSVTLAQ